MSDQVPQPPSPQQPPLAPAPQASGLGAADGTKALIFSLLGLLCCAPFLIVSAIMTFPVRKESKATGVEMDGTMKTAWIITVVGIVLFCIGIVFAIIGAMTGAISGGGNVQTY